MKVLFVATDRNLFTPWSGVANRHSHLGERFPQDSFTSVVFSTTAHNVPTYTHIRQNVEAYATHSKSRLLYGWDALRIAKALPKPDVVTAQDPFETGLIALRIARHFNVPLVVEMHTDVASERFARHSVLNRVRLVIARYVLPRAAASYAVSKVVADSVRKRYALPHTPAVIPIYVDTSSYANFSHSRRTSEEANRKTSLLWVGRLEAEKNPQEAIRALHEVRLAGHDVHLTIVGDGSLGTELVALTKELGVIEHVQFIGKVSDVRPYYANADLLLVTSYFEGYGMALVEALAAGVPVLSTDVGIAREAGAIIASGNFAIALHEWLNGTRERGVLRHVPYANEAAYLDMVRSFYADAASRTAHT